MTDFQQFYSNYLDSHYPNDAPFVDNSYTRNRDFFTLQAYNAALGGKDDAWDPVAGNAANRDRIRKLYDYYRDLYNRKPAQYLWLDSAGWLVAQLWADSTFWSASRRRATRRSLPA